MQPEQPDKSSSHYLSEKEAERYFRRNETLIEFARLFDYAEASDRAIAIIGPAFLDSLLRDILIEFMIEDEPEVNKLLQPEGLRRLREVTQIGFPKLTRSVCSVVPCLRPRSGSPAWKPFEEFTTRLRYKRHHRR